MAGRPSKLAKLTTEQLKKELARRTKVLPRLLKKRAKLEKIVAAIDSLIAAHGGEAVSKGRGGRKKAGAKKKGGKRPPREGSLKAVLMMALAGKKGVGVAEAVKAVLAAGYKSESKDFRLLVNQTLLTNGEFRKVGRGLYTLSKAVKPPVAKVPAKKKAKKAVKKIAKKKAAKVIEPQA